MNKLHVDAWMTLHIKPYLKFKQFEQLKDIKMFNTVKVAGLSIEWKNGADICPDELYNNSKII